jgi:hypothetical protein
MPSISKEFARLGDHLGNLGENIANAFKRSPLRSAGAANLSKEALEEARINRLPTAGQAAASKLFWAPAELALGIVKIPFVIAGKILNLGAKGVANFYKLPLLVTAPVTVLAGAVGINRLVNGSAEERTQREMQAKINTLQIMQAQGQPSYMNSVTPEEMMAMQARAKAQNDNAPGNFAETARPNGQVASFTASASQPAAGVTTPAV